METYKLKDIVGAQNAITELANATTSVKEAYMLAKFSHMITQEIDIYSQQRQKIIDKYCAKDENGEPIVENGDYTFASINDKMLCIKDLNDLANAETKLDLGKIPLEIFEKIDSFPVWAMTALLPFIKE